MGVNPSGLAQGSRYPLENVSWHDAQDFSKRLQASSAQNYRLAIEAAVGSGRRVVSSPELSRARLG
ncbi:hypothetical protein [Desulfotalea psychrophila]|uniref:Uncharacterized protein n=1 Tax=Desulfotalea psychrophila (strain LSv54 / DSM 12343) TaxID=177439 RepID=Q6AK26_DESPS|nr:hypothetical protein [Desulfotalea psychrophila]CAG37300.1 hypothetical protein DP2571 [Desulfotalea psychrophila LSv54]